MPRPAFKPGDVLNLQDADYMYGQGPISIRVRTLVELQQQQDGLWVYLEAMQLLPDGRDWQRRMVTVRADVQPSRSSRT